MQCGKAGRSNLAHFASARFLSETLAGKGRNYKVKSCELLFVCVFCDTLAILTSELSLFGGSQ